MQMRFGRAAILGLVALLFIDNAALYFLAHRSSHVETGPAFDEAIHGYIVGHPEVVREASLLLQKKDEKARQIYFKQTVTGQRGDIVKAEGEATSGDAEGDVTIVEFYDAQCPFCKALAPDLDRLIKQDGHVRVVYREFPVLGPSSVTAAQAELAAQQQGLYDKFHRALMADQTPELQLDERRITAIASTAGVNLARMKKDMASPEIASHIATNRDLATKMGITGTPGLLFFGPSDKSDYLSVGIMNYDTLAAKLAQLRLAARAQ